MAFPQCSFKGRYHEKYDKISTAVTRVCHVHYDCAGISNCHCRANNNIVKDLGKVKGLLRWKFYKNQIAEVVENHKSTLENLLSPYGLAQPSTESIALLREEIQRLCLDTPMPENKENRDPKSKEKEKAFDIHGIESILKTEEFPKWKFDLNRQDNSGHLYYFGGDSKGYCELEFIINNEGQWKVVLEGRPRGAVDLEWASVASQLCSVQDLKNLMRTVESQRICSGFPVTNYETVLPKDHTHPIYHTRNGDPAAFVENKPSKYHKKVIRSTTCMIFIPYDEVLSTSTICAACRHSQNYLKTLKSRGATPTEERSKFTRFDYLNKQELVEQLRKRTGELRYLQEKVKTLEKYRKNMTEVGGKTDDDFRSMFSKLQKGMSARKDKLENPKCGWKGCAESEDKFVDVEHLYIHVKSHIDVTDQDVAPIDRIYKCDWGNCGKTFAKKKLLENHLRDHTGSSSDQFFEILLKDQAKALTVPKRQMRWHPLVIKWCLRSFTKSHAAYEDLRNSGFLRLPSGRLLSDYKNFSSPRSGWQTSTIKAMKEKYEKTKYSKRGQVGRLFFDEVKIKEGLVFDPSTFELIGFTDIGDDETDIPTVLNDDKVTATPQKNIATHVLQFFYKSLFAKFEFPCAFFLTKGVTAQKLNRVFRQGVSLLHGFGFEIMLACCDGAPENRSFMNMNGTNATKSKCYNPFSKKPLFFISDPPHLMKKLRNNIYSSGFKSQNPRYTRLLEKKQKEYYVGPHLFCLSEGQKTKALCN